MIETQNLERPQVCRTWELSILKSCRVSCINSRKSASWLLYPMTPEVSFKLLGFRGQISRKGTFLSQFRRPFVSPIVYVSSL